MKKVLCMLISCAMGVCVGSLITHICKTDNDNKEITVKAKTRTAFGYM